MRLVVQIGGEVKRSDVTADETIRFTDDSGKELAAFSVADLVGRTGKCFRCGSTVSSRVEAAYLDLEDRNDCSEGEAGSVHEIDPPDGWEG